MHTHENSWNGWYLSFVFLHVAHLLEHQKNHSVVQRNTVSVERYVHNSREFWAKIFDSGPKAGFFSFHWKCHVTGAFSIRVHFLRLFSAATVWCSAAVWKHEKEDLYQRLQFFSCTNMTGCHVRSPLKSNEKALSCVLYFLRSEKKQFSIKYLLLYIKKLLSPDVICMSFCLQNKDKYCFQYLWIIAALQQQQAFSMKTLFFIFPGIS